MTHTKPKILAVDLDGTLLKYDDITQPLGEPVPGMREQLQAVKAVGWAIIIWTVRNNVGEIKKHLKKYDIPFDYINENPWGPPNSSGKIAAHVYLDDRALQFNGDTSGLASKIVQFEPWYKRR
jgi:hydroxymethylpyrimidine pyrophosphatase-like HAD family hydrolase